MKAKYIVQPQIADHIAPGSSPSAESQIPALTIALPQEPELEERAELDLQIRELAYRLYEERGRVEGQEVQDWLDAEAIVRQGSKLAA